MKKVILMPFGLFWLTGTVIVWYNLYTVFSQIILPNRSEYVFLGYGFLAFLVTLPLLPPRKYQFWNTLLHELAHAVFAVLTFSKPVELRAGDTSTNGRLGQLVHRGKQSLGMRFVRDHFVSLAPYFFPTLTLLLLGIYLLIAPQRQGFMPTASPLQPTVNGLLALLGFSYAYHLTMLLQSARPYQSDFHSLGYFYGLMFTLFMQAAILTAMVVGISYQHGTWQLLSESVPTTIQYLGHLGGQIWH